MGRNKSQKRNSLYTHIFFFFRDFWWKLQNTVIFWICICEVTFYLKKKWFRIRIFKVTFIYKKKKKTSNMHIQSNLTYSKSTNRYLHSQFSSNSTPQIKKTIFFKYYIEVEKLNRRFSSSKSSIEAFTLIPTYHQSSKNCVSFLYLLPHPQTCY